MGRLLWFGFRMVVFLLVVLLSLGCVGSVLVIYISSSGVSSWFGWFVFAVRFDFADSAACVAFVWCLFLVGWFDCVLFVSCFEVVCAIHSGFVLLGVLWLFCLRFSCLWFV